ncbi:MAG: hypothetical protein PHE88_06620 [Elusimicrobia bacterium]|nr:hypothetical protein [Elusimicrobiota bacterium]
MFKNCVKVFNMIRKDGIWVTLKTIRTYLYLFIDKRIPWYLRISFYRNLIRLIFTSNFQKKRILGIWDYKSLPWSVGDPMVFVEKLSMLKIEHKAEEVDICIVYDRDNPIGNRGKRVGGHNITSDNAQEYILELLPLFSTCPYLGSVYQFSTREEFYRFLKNNIERYDIFPPLEKHLDESYNYFGGAPHINEIQEFHNIHGYIPHLRIGERDSCWAKWFFLNHLPDKSVAVVISLKLTSHFTERNANPAVWLSFIDKCKTAFPEVVFIIVGLREEVFDGLRERSNVIIAKDFGTSVIEDLALIRASLLYMGSASGVDIIAMFSDHPYLIFQLPDIHIYGLKLGEDFSFVTDKQKSLDSTISVTPELLFNEFKQLYLKLDRDKWFSTTLQNACNKHGHPSARVESKK